MKRTLIWLTVYLLALGAATTYGFIVDHQQDVKNCQERNRTIAASTRVVAESLIEVAGTDTPQPTIDQFLTTIDRRVRAVQTDCT